MSTRRAPFWIHFLASRTSITPTPPRNSPGQTQLHLLCGRSTRIYRLNLLPDCWYTNFCGEPGFSGGLGCSASGAGPHVPALAAGSHVPALAAGVMCWSASATASRPVTDFSPGQSFPDALQRDLDAQNYHYKVVNQGTSGATTKDAVALLPAVLGLRPEVVIVEFGATTDCAACRSPKPSTISTRFLAALAAAHVKVLLAASPCLPTTGRTT